MSIPSPLADEKEEALWIVSFKHKGFDTAAMQ